MTTADPSKAKPGKARYRRVLLKVSGEAFCKPGGFGIDANDATLEAVAADDPRASDPRRAPIEHEPPPTPPRDALAMDDDEVARWLKEFGVAPDEPIDPREHEKEWWE